MPQYFIRLGGSLFDVCLDAGLRIPAGISIIDKTGPRRDQDCYCISATDAHDTQAWSNCGTLRQESGAYLVTHLTINSFVGHCASISHQFVGLHGIIEGIAIPDRQSVVEGKS